MNWKQAARIFRRRWFMACGMADRKEERLEREIMSLKDQLTAAMLERDAYRYERDEVYAAGAAAAFGVMGVAVALQERERRRPREEDDASYERAMSKIRGVKLADEAAAKKRAENKIKREKLLQALAEKQAGKLSEMSERELKKQIAELEE